MSDLSESQTYYIISYLPHLVVIVLFACVRFLVVLPFHAYLERNSDINLVLTLQSQTFGHAELFQRF